MALHITMRVHDDDYLDTSVCRWSWFFCLAGDSIIRHVLGILIN